MPRHAAPTNVTRVDVTRVERAIWLCALAVGSAIAISGYALAAVAGGQVTCAPGADLLVHADGTWTCGPSPSASPSPSGSPTASPSPTLTSTPPSTTNPPATTTAPPSSPPAPSPTLRDCLHNLAACGLPNDLNTGPVLPLTISTRTQYASPGETISGVDIRGCVEVRAANVTFRNVRIAAGCFWAVRSFAANAVFEDVEITCNNTPGSNGYSNGSGGSVILRRADIHNCENGLNVPGNTTVVDSWIHNLYDGGDAHTDGAQFNQGAANIVFSHNTIDARGNTTSAIIQWDEGNPQNSNVLIANNLLAGGSYTLYCARQGPVTNVRIVGNRITAGSMVNGDFVPDVPEGPTYGWANSCVGNHVTEWSGNIRDFTGAALVAA